MTTATLGSAVVVPRARWYRNSVVVVLAGLFANATLSSATDMILVAAGVGLVIGVAGAIATWSAWQSWYSLAIIAVTLPSGWLGVRIAQSH